MVAVVVAVGREGRSGLVGKVGGTNWMDFFKNRGMSHGNVDDGRSPFEAFA